MVATGLRRSTRLAALGASADNEKPKPIKRTTNRKTAKVPAKPKKSGKLPKSKKGLAAKADLKEEPDKLVATKKVTKKATKTASVILPRMRENELRQEGFTHTFIMGIDEAGRGPLAGPVVAAAAAVPVDIPGITDSKKITCEATREELYGKIVTSGDVSWAVAVVDAGRIDEINILQATMQAMSMAASALVNDSDEAKTRWHEACKQPACASRKGCYVACGGKLLKPKQNNDASDTQKADKAKSKEGDDNAGVAGSSYYALVDGNRVPADLPCEGESIVKGDSKEYSIAAASILAKVTRDRLMHSYDLLWPEYKLGKHKGYPTKEHMAAVFDHGASPIHRRTFAPLKHMTFDADGKIVDESTD